MRQYIIYDLASGEIEATYRLSDEVAMASPPDGKGAIESNASWSSCYVLGGAVIEYTLEQAAAKAARPSLNHRWSNETFSWSDPYSSAERELAATGATVREKRNIMLADSDWTDTLSAKARLGDALYNSWQDYRQILRDVPQQAGFPSNIAWPEPLSPT